MDYVYQNEYFKYMLEDQRAQQKMYAYIQECAIISEGKSIHSKLVSLNEDVGDKIRNGWDKFVAFIKRVWAKFTESITRMMNTDVGYLEKYKDIILGKKVKEVSITMRPYNIGLQRITQSIIPTFSTNLLDTINANDDKDIKFKKSLIHTYDGKTEFPSYVKEYFLGGEEQELHEHDIKMTDLYNFCKDKKKIIGNLEKDQKTIIDAANASQKALSDKLNTMKTASSNNTNTSNTNTSNNNTNTSNSNTATTAQKIYTNTTGDTINHVYKGNSYTLAPNKSIVEKDGKVVVESTKVLSNVYDMIITEAITINKPGNGNSSASASVNSGVASQSGGTSSVRANTTNNVDANHDTDKQNVQDAKLTKEEIDTLEKKITVYRNDTSTVLTAKMTAVETIYRDYMKIIKKHVSDYAGTDKSGDNTTAQAGTDYTNNRTKELDDATKNNLTNAIKEAENEKDEVAKLDKQKEVISIMRKYDPNSRHNYQAIKDLVGYK